MRYACQAFERNLEHSIAKQAKFAFSRLTPSGPRLKPCRLQTWSYAFAMQQPMDGR